MTKTQLETLQIGDTVSRRFDDGIHTITVTRINLKSELIEGKDKDGISTTWQAVYCEMSPMPGVK